MTHSVSSIPLTLALLLVTAAAGEAAEPTAADRATAVVDAAHFTYETSFRLPCSQSTWQALVGDPVLFADLWNAYGYGPAYQVSIRGAQIHVADPTGLVGDMSPVLTEPNRRQYFVRGRLDHWAVPFLNEGLAVFILDTRPEGAFIVGQVSVHIQAASAFGGLVLQLGRPVLAEHVENRIRLNLRDAGQLLEAIETRPQAVRRKVGDKLWARLQGVLAAAR